MSQTKAMATSSPSSTWGRNGFDRKEKAAKLPKTRTTPDAIDAMEEGLATVTWVSIEDERSQISVGLAQEGIFSTVFWPTCRDLRSP